LSGTTVYFLQIPVHEGHPATKETLNISSNFTDCPSFAFFGIILDTNSTGDDGAVGLRVADGVLLNSNLIFPSQSDFCSTASAPSRSAISAFEHCAS
jgi:hypothetical protein